MTDADLSRRIAFLLETEKLNYILRQTPVADGSRRENDAEHSFHFALMAMTLAPYAAEEINLDRVVQMALLHDLIEVYAGDTYVYDKEANRDKAARESAAADRLYGLLPAEQGSRFYALWREFDDGRTADARFAACIDRFQPLLMNYQSGGLSWREHQVSAREVRARIAEIKSPAPALHAYAQTIIEKAVENGWLLP